MNCASLLYCILKGIKKAKKKSMYNHNDVFPLLNILYPQLVEYTNAKCFDM